jgi:hypothetical protein
MTDKIPIVAAETIGKAYHYDQVVIYARRVGDDSIEWVTTWERNRAHCDVAARIGATICKGVVEPLETMGAEITRLTALVGTEAEREEIEDMAAVGRSLMAAIATATAEPAGLLAGWHPVQDPAEIVGDLLDRLDETTSDVERLMAVVEGLGVTDAARAVLDERRRQTEVEGFDTAHDDTHSGGEMARAAACYAAYHALSFEDGSEILPRLRPDTWSHRWWNPSDHRRDLVKAGALILAEIERLDRLTAKEADHG